MLSDDAERYIALRRSLGYKLRKVARHLQSFAAFATDRGETHVRAATATAWAATAPTLRERARRLAEVARFARFLQAQDAAHEVPTVNPFAVRETRPMPYIYTQDEIARILDAAGKLRRQKPNPLRHQLYVMLFGLIAATGLRVSEALALQFDDVLPGGVLRIRETKFGKSRLVPLHESVEALNRYLDARRRLAGTSDLLFPSTKQKELQPGLANYTFRCLVKRAGIAPNRRRTPRIHDLRHTFATRVLEQCGAGRGAVARHVVALSTYLGHGDIRGNLARRSAYRGLMTLTAGLRVVEGPESIGRDVLDLVEKFLVSLAPVRIGKSVALVLESGERFLGLRGRLSAGVDCRGEQDGAGDQQ